jgi:hypothetical protein
MMMTKACRTALCRHTTALSICPLALPTTILSWLVYSYLSYLYTLKMPCFKYEKSLGLGKFRLLRLLKGD